MPASPWLERYREFVQRGLDGADALVAPTRWMASALGANFNVGANVRIIANGRTFSLQGSVLPRRLQAVSVGRIWDESKGIQTILDVESSMPILVAGENSFEGAKQSTGKLRALGLLDEPELLQVFCESSIYIASSTYEPFGLAPLEAAMCGCAVVARDIDSFREVWADGALYFRDAAELGGMLRRLNCEKDALCQARSQSMARAQGYNADAMARGYLNLYEELTGNATSSLICLKELPVYAE
jgi:glycosyltransferase involved in cell wall biosynthesis